MVRSLERQLDDSAGERPDYVISLNVVPFARPVSA
jgi:hypothetical protein